MYNVYYGPDSITIPIMTITADRARDVARDFAVTRESLPWSDANTTVLAGTFAGRDCWIVATQGEEDPAIPWTEAGRRRPSIRYFIARNAASCLGFANERVATVLPEPWTPPG